MKTFDDLIDIAVKARKDDHIGSLTIHPLNIAFKWGGEDKLFDLNEVCEGISFFESLYTEEFVIEDESSLLKVTDSIKSLVLANGCDIADCIHFDDEGMYYKDGWGNEVILGINILKGSTVTQEK